MEGPRGQPSIPPGVYFRMLLAGYFEAIDSQRRIAWRCADSLSLRQFLGNPLAEGTPDPKTLNNTAAAACQKKSLTRCSSSCSASPPTSSCFPAKPLASIARCWNAHAAMTSIVRRDTGGDWKQFVARLMHEAGVIDPDHQPSDEEIRRFDKKRQTKRVSN